MESVFGEALYEMGEGFAYSVQSNYEAFEQGGFGRVAVNGAVNTYRGLRATPGMLINGSNRDRAKFGIQAFVGYWTGRAVASRIPGAEAATGGLGDAVDAVFDSGRVSSGTMIRADARSLSGPGPKSGQGGIWYHDNVGVGGAGPGGVKVNLRTHSPNPNAPPGSYSGSNYTTQINTNNGRYLLPDGNWKKIADMTPAERAAAHYPAGN